MRSNEEVPLVDADEVVDILSTPHTADSAEHFVGADDTGDKRSDASVSPAIPSDELTEEERRAKNRRDIIAIVVLVLFLFLHEFQPSQPFLVPYWKKVLEIPVQRIFDSIFPWSTYSMLLMGPLAAACLYLIGLRPTLFLSAIAACGQTVLSLYGNKDSRYFMLILSEIVWAFGFGSLFVVLIAKFTLLPRRYFHTIASVNKGASMIAVLLSSLLGQIIVDYGGQQQAEAYRTNFYITIACTGAATLLVFTLPKPHSAPRPFRETLRGARDAFKSERGATAMWALCYQVVQADSFLLVTYWQTLFAQIDPKRAINGYVFASARACGSVASLLPAFFALCRFSAWQRFSSLICMVLTCVAGVVVCALTFCNSVAVAMPLFCLQHACTELTEVVCLAQVAIGVNKTPTADFAWVFSFNYFLSVCMQVAMQLVIQHLSVMQGYRALGGILVFDCLLFVAFAVVRLCLDRAHDRKAAARATALGCPESDPPRSHGI